MASARSECGHDGQVTKRSELESEVDERIQLSLTLGRDRTTQHMAFSLLGLGGGIHNVCGSFTDPQIISPGK